MAVPAWHGRIVERLLDCMGRRQPSEAPNPAGREHYPDDGQDGRSGPGDHVSGQSHDRIGVSTEEQKRWLRLPSWRTAVALLLSVIGLAIIGVGVFVLRSDVNGVGFSFLCDLGFIPQVLRGSPPCAPLSCCPSLVSGTAPSVTQSGLRCCLRYIFLFSYTPR